MNLPLRKKMMTAVFLSIILFLLVTGKIPLYAEGNIEIILKNFYDMDSLHGNSKNPHIVEVGIPAGKHILIVKNCHSFSNCEKKYTIGYIFFYTCSCATYL